MKYSAKDANDSSNPRYPLRSNFGQTFNLIETQLPPPGMGVLVSLLLGLGHLPECGSVALFCPTVALPL